MNLPVVKTAFITVFTSLIAEIFAVPAFVLPNQKMLSIKSRSVPRIMPREPFSRRDSTSLFVPFMSNVYTEPTNSTIEGISNAVLMSTEPQVIDLVYDDPVMYMESFSATNSANSLSSALNVDTESQSSNSDLQHVQVVGHRGSPYQELENTRRGFQLCSEMGCDAVELDVFLLKCGTLVVFHGGGDDASPGWLNDYCNVEGSILDYTAEEARSQLIFNPHFAEFGCGPDKIKNNGDVYIPLLEEVLLDAKMTGLTVKIELKGPGTAQPVVELVDKLGMADQCRYSSFNHEHIATVRKMRPELNVDGTYRYKTGALFGDDVPHDFVNIAKRAGSSEVHLKYDTCTKERIKSIHEAGMDSMAWFRGPIGMKEDVTTKYCDVRNEDADMYHVVMATGVKSMCVNKPDVLLETLRRTGSAGSSGTVYEIDGIQIMT